ncbi:hypothetical protein BJ322DRAFT_1021125 [Thelephora terrestris]|uniref:Uncharacterized protein n=1 Tax=Thelephora terrestris TaxID=56493 RepID=A0A9P6HCJ2_9AGAM|nr:hypothetical protein BJ322DRAFT_1021125 [Thelephora terrestris]
MEGCSDEGTREEGWASQREEGDGERGEHNEEGVARAGPHVIARGRCGESQGEAGTPDRTEERGEKRRGSGGTVAGKGQESCNIRWDRDRGGTDLPDGPQAVSSVENKSGTGDLFWMNVLVQEVISHLKTVLVMTVMSEQTVRGIGVTDLQCAGEPIEDESVREDGKVVEKAGSRQENRCRFSRIRGPIIFDRRVVGTMFCAEVPRKMPT